MSREAKHYSEMSQEEYHAEYIVSDKVCTRCNFSRKQYFMGAVPVGPNPNNLNQQEWKQTPTIIQWCTLPASPKFGTLVAAFGTCDHIETNKSEPEVVTDSGEEE